MAWQIFGQQSLSGHNYLGVNSDGSINTLITNTDPIQVQLPEDPLPVSVSGTVSAFITNTDPLPISVSETLEVSLPSLISLVNSTSATLLSSGTFTGTAERCNGYGIIYVTAYSDVASATDGLKIQQSPDGTNWDTEDVFTIPAATGKNFSVDGHSKYYRVTYTNGLSGQSEFRLQSILKNSGKPSSHRIQDSIIGDDDAELVKAVITGSDSDGHFHNVGITHDGYLAISDNSSGLSIAQGHVTGVSSVQKFGYAPDFDQTDGDVTVWDGAEDGTTWELMRYLYSSSADIDSISSSNNTDVTEVTVIGLNSSWAEVSQTVTLNGQTRVALPTPLIRVYRAFNANNTEFVGHVIVYVNTALTAGVPSDKTKIRLIIDPNAQQTLMAVYSIPAGKTGYLTKVYASTAGASKSSTYIMKLYVREFGKVFRMRNINAIGDTSSAQITTEYDVPIRLPEKSDVEVRTNCTAAGATGASIAAGFDIILVNN